MLEVYRSLRMRSYRFARDAVLYSPEIQTEAINTQWERKTAIYASLPKI